MSIVSHNIDAYQDRLTPAIPAKASYIDTVTTASQVLINLTSGTKLIEVTNLSDTNFVYLKYATGVAATDGNFDEIISLLATRHYLVPDSVKSISLISTGGDATVVTTEK